MKGKDPKLFSCMERRGAILVIDDDEDYSCLVEIAFQEAGVDYPMELAQDGWQAVDYLSRTAPENADATAAIPSLVLLDLRMPGITGLEVLRWIRSQPYLNDVPVVVFTGLEAGEEPSQAFDLGATSLRLKPFAYRELVEEAKHLNEMYLEAHEVRHAA